MSDIQKIKSVAATKVSSNIGTISSNNNISKIEDYKTTNTDVEELSLDEEPSLFDDITQVFKSTGATIATFEASLAEGVGKLGESLVDFTALAGTAIISPIDFVIGKILGEEGGYGEVTKDLWDATKSFVSTDHVGNAFDSLYENTEIGNWVKENSYGFDTVRSIGTNVGEIAGIIALSIATCGAAGVISGGAIGASTAVGSVSLSTAVSASLATMKGVSTSTVKAWNEGASTFKGMAYGGAHGIWEGTQWIIGGKIGELGKVGARVALDGVNGAIDSIVQPTMQKIYSDKTFKELWDENGGVKSLIINTGTALGFSALSEVSNLRKLFAKEKKVNAFVDNIDTESYANSLGMDEQLLKQKLARYQELQTYQQTDNYIKSEINSKLGYAQNLKQAGINESVKRELKQLENEFDTLGINYTKDTQISKKIQKEVDRVNSIPDFNPSIVKEDVSNVIDVMKRKYGLDETQKRLEYFFETGDYNIITRDGDARKIFKQYSMEDLKTGYALSQGLLEPPIYNYGVGKKPLIWGEKESAGFQQIHGEEFDLRKSFKEMDDSEDIFKEKLSKKIRK